MPGKAKRRDIIAQPRKKGDGIHKWITMKLSVPHTQARHLQAIGWHGVETTVCLEVMKMAKSF